MAVFNGVKKISVELTKEEARILVRAIDAVIAQVKRSVAKETDQRIVELRNQSITELQTLANHIAYGGKELV